MDYHSIIIILLLSGLSVISVIIGIGLAFFCQHSQKMILAGIGFSAGIMLLISFFELVPEAWGEAGAATALSGIIFGILLIGLLNEIIPHYHISHKHRRIKSGFVRVAYLVAIGLVLHDFPEGFAMANSYAHSANLGVFVALAIALHNIPEEFAISVPLLVIGDKKRLLLFAGLSAIAEPLGALLGILAIGILPGLNAFLLAFSAGAMIFISLHELLPLAKKEKSYAVFAVGFIASILVFVLLNYFLSE